MEQGEIDEHEQSESPKAVTTFNLFEACKEISADKEEESQTPVPFSEMVTKVEK